MPSYTDIFEVLGVFARAFGQINNLADRNLMLDDDGETFRSLDRLREEFIEVLNDSPDERDALRAVAVLTGAAETVRAWREPLRAALDAWLRDGLARELNVSGTGAEIIDALARAMHADSQSVQANDVSVGEVQAAEANAGDAACYASALTVDPGEQPIDDQRVRAQRVTVECVRDTARHRVPTGQEEFRVRPEHGPAAATRVIPATVGAAIDPRNAIRDGAFAAYDAGFTYWQLEAGGAVFSQEAAETLFGGAALKITGDGATAGDLRQDLAWRDPPLESGRVFALGVWARVESHAAGAVTVDVLIDGEASALQLVINGDMPTGEWLHLGGFVYLPRASFPNKVKARVRCDAAFDGTVLLDGLSLAPAADVPHAGLRVAIFQGPNAPQAAPVADRYTIDTSSDDAGAFQTFVRDVLAAALPASDTPTINENLA